MISNVLVVCAGNICRSPMAEALLHRVLKDYDVDAVRSISVSSCGLTAVVDSPAAELAVEVMDECGIDIRAHRGRQIDPQLVDWADLVLVMEESHRKAIHRLRPSSRGKVFRIGHFDSIDVPDPYRKPKEAFIAALGIIRKGVAQWAGKIADAHSNQKELG